MDLIDGSNEPISRGRRGDDELTVRQPAELLGAAGPIAEEELPAVEIVCGCGDAFTHRPKRMTLLGKTYTVPPITPTRCERCREELRREQELADLRRVAADRGQLADLTVPTLYREATIADLTKTQREFIVEWAATARAENRSVYINGIAGAGKTHIAAAAVRHVITEALFARVVWANVPDMLDRIRRSYSDNEAAARLSDEIESADLLVLDDLGREKPNEWVAERLYTIINRRYERMQPVLVTSNETLDGIEALVGRPIARRLAEMCVQVKMRSIYRPAADTEGTDA